ncbi:MAG: hypothetical protein NVV73_19740 [Cellvibrionaceae bacterium]|nr:hypothetical protein [Cellvibrionaceae bacterium]
MPHWKSWGYLQVAPIVDVVPPFAEMDAESLYLGWEITLESAAGEAAIREVFEWVIDTCELTVQDISPPPATPVLAAMIASPTEKAEVKSSPPEGSSIRVGIDKIDSLINMVGELVIIQSMLGEIGSNFTIAKLPKLVEGLAQLEQNTRELQESVMRIRMLPISFVFSRFPRMVRDLAQQLQKKSIWKCAANKPSSTKPLWKRLAIPSCIWCAMRRITA